VSKIYYHWKEKDSGLFYSAVLKDYVDCQGVFNSTHLNQEQALTFNVRFMQVTLSFLKKKMPQFYEMKSNCTEQCANCDISVKQMFVEEVSV